MATNCYVRIWQPNDPNEDWGYYDLYIEGTVTVKGKPLTDPVFCYYSDSNLYIYPNARTKNNYPYNTWAQKTVYRYKFSSNSLSDFQDNLSAAISSFDPGSNANLVKCYLASNNVFATYSRQRINSFCAVAYWCDWLGNSVLKDVYNTAHNTAYEKYLPATLLDNSFVSSSWVPATMNGD